MSELWRRIRFLYARDRFERELDEELRHHLELSGSPRRLGNVALIKEDSRAMWTFAFWEQLAQDARYGLRAMASNKLFTAMAVLSLALGIGANTAIFSFMDDILLRALPVRKPSELVLLNWRASGRTPVVHSLNGSMYPGETKGSRISPNFPFAALELLRQNRDIASSVFAYASAYDLNLVARNRAEVVQGLYVSGNFYDGLGVIPAQGRLISVDDDRTGAPAVATITYDYWQSHFASDPKAVGQTIVINNMPFTVVGVSAPGFYGVDGALATSVFMPLHARPLLSPNPVDQEKRRFFDANFYWIEIMARLRPGVTREQAQGSFGPLFHRFVLSTAANENEKKVVPGLRLQDGAGGLNQLRNRYSKPLYILMAMVGLILVIACANIANLLLARSTARRREMAIRLSLGAGRLRIVRQLLTESVLMALMGGVAGLAFAWMGIRALTWLMISGEGELTVRASLNLPVLEFTFALAVATGVLFGLAPALQSARRDVAPALKESRIGDSRGPRRFGLSRILLVSQIAISLLLVVAAGLFIRTLSNIHSIDLGFKRENILLFRVDAGRAGYKDEALARFYGGLAERMRSVPGVVAAGLSDLPLASGYWNDTGLEIPGAPALASGKKREFSPVSVDEAFLGTLQIPVVLGRSLEARDMVSPRVAVITEKLAKIYFAGENPVGRRIGIDGGTPDIEIVGVVRTSRYNSIKEEDTPPVAYLPYTQDRKGLTQVFFEVRTAGDPLALANTMRQIVHDANPTVPISHLTTQAAQIDQTIGQERMFAALCGCFAALALAIACVGLYGTMAYMVARRTSEIGIRVAMGAPRGGIVWMVLREAIGVAAVGLAIGLAVAWQTAHVVASFLYGVKPNDPVAMIGSALVLLIAAILAGYAPAWRASRIDPMVALRHE